VTIYKSHSTSTTRLRRLMGAGRVGDSVHARRLGMLGLKGLHRIVAPGDAAGARVKRAGSSTYQAKPRAPFARGRGRADRRGGSRCRARSGRRALRFEDGYAGPTPITNGRQGSFDVVARAPRPMPNPAPTSVRDLRMDCRHMRTPNATELARVMRRGLAPHRRGLAPHLCGVA